MRSAHGPQTADAFSQLDVAASEKQKVNLLAIPCPPANRSARRRSIIPQDAGLAVFLLVSSAVLGVGEPTRAPASDIARTDVFVSGSGGYHTYRIPAVIVTNDGTLLAFCEGRKNSRADHGDIDLLLRRSTDLGRTWSPAAVVYEEGGAEEITIGNPCPVVDGTTGRIWLPFCRNNDRVLMAYSDDHGQTWSAPREITDQVKKADWRWYATGPGVGIQLRHGRHAGRLLIPCDHSQPVDGETVKFSHVFYSDDQGQTWSLGESVARHTDECQVVELRNGLLMINMRNYWGRDGKRPDRDRMRAVAVSTDGGHSWEKLRFDANLVEPICQASLVAAPATAGRDSHRLLFCNPASRTSRHRLTVRASLDGGHTWPRTAVLHTGPAAYCCLAILPDGQIGCLYESGKRHPYERIVFARFPFDCLNSAAGG